jgi:TPR repeat protein
MGFFCFPVPSQADQFLDGFYAYASGDYVTALRLWEPLAEEGHADAQLNMGIMHDEGQGVEENHRTAVQWFRKAAEQGNAEAQYRLGLMYADGDGVAKDSAEAMEWLKKAAEQRHGRAQFFVGYMYGHGLGVSQDYVQGLIWVTISHLNLEDEALRELAKSTASEFAAELTPEQKQRALPLLYQQAAEQGDVGSEFLLGMMYVTGQDVPQDVTRGVKWLVRAAEHGHTKAQLSLSMMYETGEGVPRDLMNACTWLIIFVESLPDGEDLKPFAEHLDEVAAELTPEQYAEAQAQATEWLRKHR